MQRDIPRILIMQLIQRIASTNVFTTHQVIYISNHRVLSFLVFILWTFEKYDLFDCYQNM